MNEEVVAASGKVVLGWFVRFSFTANLLVVWLGYWLMSGEWPGSFRLWLCTALGIASIAWSVLGRRQIREGLALTRARRIISARVAVAFVALILVEAVFVTWVISGPPMSR